MRRGLSLIEVIISVTILAMALTLIVGLLPGASLSNLLARQRMLAGSLAQDVLEAADKSKLDNLAPGPLDALEVEGTEFRRQVERTPLSPPSAAVRFRVTVSWTHGEQERSVFREMVLSEVPR